MIREINDEFTKIDIRRFNSERKRKNIMKFLYFMDEYMNIFIKYKSEIIKELDKILILNEQFLLDLIIFRTERGCFNISTNELANQIDCISTSYKVAKIRDDIPLEKYLKKSTKNYNNSHLDFNPALSWMLFMLFKNSILNETIYNEYISKFNNESKKYEQIAKEIRKEGILKYKQSLYANDSNIINNNEEEEKIENKEEVKEEVKNDNENFVKEESKNEFKKDLINDKIEKEKEKEKNIIINKHEETKKEENKINEVKNDENIKKEKKEELKEKISHKKDKEIKEDIKKEEKKELKQNVKEVNKNKNKDKDKENNMTLKKIKTFNNVRRKYPKFLKNNRFNKEKKEKEKKKSTNKKKK